MDSISRDKLFGQYLLRFRKPPLINEMTLARALIKQENEDKEGKPHRKIGIILLEDFDVFEGIIDLADELENFYKFKREFID